MDESPLEAVQVSISNGPACVLVVDDEPMVLKMTVQMAEALGHRVLAAKSGAEALAYANEPTEEISVALVDVFLPDMKGPDLAEELRRVLPDLRIVFMSGSVGGFYLESRVPGAIWLPKPFAKADLELRLTGSGRPEDAE